MRSRRAGVGLWVFFTVALVIFTSGAVVMYTVFMKPENKSTVPLLVGKSTVEAVSEAENLGLVVQIEPAASTLPEGRVLAQSPQQGAELRKGQIIVLQVSRGGELHAVPDVRGQTLADAQATIKAQGFSLGDVIRIHEGSTPAGNVIAQSPAAPAQVAAGRKIDLLVQEGGNADGTITIPDVNRMTEKEAREVIEASGLKVQGVDKVYSPLMPEGLAIETRPAAGSILRKGQGVILKLATLKRPAGYMDADNPNARKVTNTPQTTTPPKETPKTTAQPKTTTPNREVTVNVRGAGEVKVGSTTATTPPPASQTTKAATTSKQQAKPAATTPAPASSSGGSKTARIRYVVPPLAQPMNLRIEITDTAGTRNVMNRQVRSGETISTTAKYNNECLITIYLGGSSVWQEKQK